MIPKSGLVIASLLVLPLISVADLAPVTPVPADVARVLKLPADFQIKVFAKIKPAGSDFFRGARSLAFDAEGHLYLSTGRDNQVLMLPDRNKDGLADEIITVADKLNAPQGLAFVGDKLLVANQDGVVVLEKNAQKPNSQPRPAGKISPLISGLATGGHTLKAMKIGPDGFLYLNVGSSCNVCVESDPLRATILRYSVQGQPAGALTTLGRHAASPIWASGLRNSEGMAWQPQTGALYATNHGADMRSGVKNGAADDDLPPEHLNKIEAGKNYGWPHCWGNQFTDPNFPGAEGFCATTQPPAITFDAHAAPIGITFLNQSNFPPEYRNDAIVALHGSWNRTQPSGYKLVRVKFKQGKPVEVVDFATGWLSKEGAWGRPVDVVVGPDGALYLSDDRAGLVYRISYHKKAAQ
ncbi:MAG: PQQ-dependent sugar dehydrogenase [Methylophilaceae bacterium]